MSVLLQTRASKIPELLVISASNKNISKVERFVENLVENLDLSSELYGNILISVTESVTNAIVHGNQLNEDKKVYIFYRKSCNQVSFVIKDEGFGFDYNNIPDPTLPENILQVGGRGVFLMNQLSDELVFQDNGATVKLIWNIL